MFTTPLHLRLFRAMVGLFVSGVAVLTSPLSSQPRTFDHSAFTTLLGKHVVSGLVNYDGFATADFKAYLAELAAFDPSSLSKTEGLAFWINAYNAYTIQLINKHGERKSIRNINKTAGLIKAYGPWTEKLAVVGGTAYGLDDIEQGIIRPRYQDARVHFALVCAAMGCPFLRSEAYTGARLDEQLDDQARIFLLHSPAKNRVDPSTRTVYLSPIFIDFRDYIKDFGGSKASVGKYVARYFPAGAAHDLLASGSYKTVVTDYDWTLNSQANARR